MLAEALPAVKDKQGHVYGSGSDSCHPRPFNLNALEHLPDVINVVDLLEIPPHLGETGPNMRHDLSPDWLVNVVDILEIPPFVGATC